MGYSCEEIAAIARCPVGTVKTRMFHARRKLRTILATAAAPKHAGKASRAQAAGAEAIAQIPVSELNSCTIPSDQSIDELRSVIPACPIAPTQPAEFH